MILQNDELFVTISNTVFRHTRTGNRQFIFDPDALQGFFDGVNVKRTETTRPNQWGDFSEPGLLGARHITLTGAAVASSPEELLSMRDEFTALLSHGEYKEISVQNSVQKRYITVALEGSPSWVQKIDTTAVWKLELYAPDPRMFGPQQSIQITDSTVSGGIDYPMNYPVNYGGGIKVMAVSMFNAGNTEAWPVFKVTGDFMQGFSITDGGDNKITYEGIVTMTAPVTIDTGAGTARQGGIDKSVNLSKREWFNIPAGKSIQPLFLPKQDAAGWCDIMFRDTWI